MGAGLGGKVDEERRGTTGERGGVSTWVVVVDDIVKFFV